MMNSLALVLVAATRVLIAAESGNIADALSAQKPFAANEGFAFEATFNCANANRHPAGAGRCCGRDANDRRGSGVSRAGRPLGHRRACRPATT